MSTFETNQPVKLTKKRVDAVEPPLNKSQLFIRDADLPGFALRVTKNGTKSFIIEKRIKGKVKRITLGKYGILTVEEARRLAQRELAKIAMGDDPIAERKTIQAKAVTLEQAFEGYKKARKDLKPKTISDYTRHMENDLGTWQKKAITEITIKMVAKRHREIGLKSGPYQANAVFRTLKALLNFARFEYLDGNGQPVLSSNPVEYLNHTKAWYPRKRRKNFIKPHQLAPWHQAVMNIKGPDKLTSSHVIADFLLLILFTGLRHQEAAKLRWEHVDLEDRSLYLPDPKNREPFTLPLSDFVMEIMKERRELAVNEYVFPDRDGKKHLIEPRRQMRLITEATGIQFSVHDLRRTFATIANSLDFSNYTIKRLINHKVSGDVTDGYIICDVEQMRAPMQQVADFLKQKIGIANKDNVVYLESRRK
ncbi:MAG: integrase arm-type DNA-binding domain-containing protein [Sedimenticola sp.]|nr:integrase arm-type DNA-binding domain-containing protein [Sedimenticola sp.]